MCGIAGFAGTNVGGAEASARIRRMCDAILHRGPDSDGYHVAEGIAFGMRRLKVIDVSGGDQPLTNEDGTVRVVFNGEIYNHHALRDELRGAGHTFRTRSDTEVLVHLYEQYGDAMVERLHGMFAFSIWDERRRRLFIARDRSGMKPLSYRILPDGIVYGSELRSIWAFDSAELRVDPQSIMQYLAFGYVPDPGSIFEGVAKLPPGHSLSWSQAEGASIRRYWSPPEEARDVPDERAAVDSLRQLLLHAVESHLESEVPLGAFLSGGLDSSTVVAAMTRLAKGRVKTFSIGFTEAAYDESGYARAIARELGTDHQELIVNPNIGELFEPIALMFDEPFGDSSALPTFLVSQLARASVTVALSGDAGDELFGGYDRYPETLRMRRYFTDGVLGALGPLLPHGFPGRNWMAKRGRTAAGRYASTVALPLRVDEGGVARSGIPGADVPVGEQLLAVLAPGRDADLAFDIMRADFLTYLPGDIHTKVDRASMAVSLEARVPFLDVTLVDYALGLPGRMRVTRNETKRLFRQAIRGLAPEQVFNRRKQGFAVPLGEWLRGPLRERTEAVAGAAAEVRPYVDAKALQRISREHISGRRDHSAVLWRLMVLNYWLAGLRAGALGRPPVVPRAAF